MAHFALVNDNNIVEKVIVVSNDSINNLKFPASEPAGREFLRNNNFSGTWYQCSYNGNFRKQFPGNGFKYDPKKDIFIAQQPYPSWKLDKNNDWQPPTPKPVDENLWDWDEKSQKWFILN
jgi:hypothetical protein